MNRSTLAAITTISLILLALCCQVIPLGHLHDVTQSMAQPLAHTLLLMMDLPVAMWFTVFFILVTLLVMQPHSRILARDTNRTYWRFLYRDRAQRPFAAPLQLAFADGILHPKLY